jgi:hypothetical protein
VVQFSQVVLAAQVAMMMGFMLGVILRNSPGAIVGYFVYALVIHRVSAAIWLLIPLAVGLRLLLRSEIK